jgi:DNA-binding transcriptional regulator YdaS (Cro superfamily)
MLNINTSGDLKKMIIDEIIVYFGSRAKLARLLQVDRSAVTMWVNKDRAIPPKRAIEIEVLSEGKFLAKDIVLEWWRAGDRDDSAV